MRSRFLRALLTLTAFAVVWFVVSPASAAAPVCDPRGAIGFAPPPQIQAPLQSIDLPESCVADAKGEVNGRDVVPGPRMIEFGPSQDYVATPAPQAAPARAGVRIAAPRASVFRTPPGVRRSIERPPRA